MHFSSICTRRTWMVAKSADRVGRPRFVIRGERWAARERSSSTRIKGGMVVHFQSRYRLLKHTHIPLVPSATTQIWIPPAPHR